MNGISKILKRLQIMSDINYTNMTEGYMFNKTTFLSPMIETLLKKLQGKGDLYIDELNHIRQTKVFHKSSD